MSIVLGAVEGGVGAREDAVGVVIAVGGSCAVNSLSGAVGILARVGIVGAGAGGGSAEAVGVGVTADGSGGLFRLQRACS